MLINLIGCQRILIDGNAFPIDLAHIMNNGIETLPNHVADPLKNSFDRIENRSIATLF